jgi:hypothetical protein
MSNIHNQNKNSCARIKARDVPYDEIKQEEIG